MGKQSRLYKGHQCRFSGKPSLPVLANLANFSTNSGNLSDGCLSCGGASAEDELSNVGGEGLVRRRGDRDDLWNGWWTRGRRWQEGRHTSLHHCRPVRKTPNLIKLHLSFFEGGEKNNFDFPTTIASAERCTAQDEENYFGKIDNPLVSYPFTFYKIEFIPVILNPCYKLTGKSLQCCAELCPHICRGHIFLPFDKVFEEFS